MADLLTPVLGIPYANGDDPLGNVDVAMGNLADRVEEILSAHERVDATQQVVSSTTLVDITEMTFAIPASTGTTHRYKLNGTILYTGPAAGDMKLDLRFPLISCVSSGHWLGFNASDVLSIFRLQSDVTVVLGADPGFRAVAFEAILQVTNQGADTARFRFAQNVSNATPVVIQIGSHYFLQRIM
jgi:hypothetical protein